MSTGPLPSFHSSTILTPNHAQHTVAAFAEAAPERRILAVEPDIAALHAGSSLLTRANYCVTPATSDRKLFLLRDGKAFPLVILSDGLGQRQLGSVAETVRRQWPRTRILILGQVPMGLEDYLYDEQIQRSSDPRDVLAHLESLYKGMWNQRSNTLDWDAVSSARRVARPPTSESEPTRTVTRALAGDMRLRDTSSDSREPVTRNN